MTQFPLLNSKKNEYITHFNRDNVLNNSVQILKKRDNIYHSVWNILLDNKNDRYTISLWLASHYY